MKRTSSHEAIEFIKQNKRLLIETFANDNICPSQNDAVSIFMAGSPGAGKTEFCKNFIRKSGVQVVRIDADDIRNIIPQYTGKNSNRVQGAAALGVEKLYDYVLAKGKSCILDGTFSKLDIVHKDVGRSIKRGRTVSIFYVYQDPLLAWKFTKAREFEEGRSVPKGIFVEAFFNAKKNAETIKMMYGEKVRLFLIERNAKTNSYNFHSDIDAIDQYLKMPYTIADLKSLL
ncbi:zeta toxin family protein [Candidatus Peregrinibacteria bacterium]|nr:zeta toxin family protein [Candidatus Peregrinibacteria bacterium]